MSIESKEIKDIHALYQNLYEETARERMRKNIERVKNPFGNTTIVTKDGKELKQGDDGFDDALANARKTVRDANNKSLNAADRKANEKSGLGSGSSSSSSSSSSSNTKKRISGESSLSKKEFDAAYDSDDKVVKALDDDEKKKVIKTPSKPKLDRETGDPGPRTAPTSQKDEVITKPASKVITKGGPDRSGTQSSTAEKSKPQLGGHAKRNAQKIEKRRVEKIKANQPAPTEKDLEDGKKEADTANIAKLSGKYKEVPAPGPGNDGKTVLQKVKNPNPKDNKLDPTPIKKPVAKPVPVAAKPKITARSQMRQRNIDRFGADKVNNLINKQKDFKTMQRGGTQTPFAASQDKLKPGVAKSQFAAKYKNSNVAKDLKKSKRVTQVMDLESYDAYDLVLDYLLETNQVDTIEEANYVMIQMDESTIQGIVNEYA